MSSTATPSPPAARGPRAWWRGLSRRQRTTLRALFGVSLLLVLAVSVLLARFLTVENLERDDDLALVQAEARGSLAGILHELSGCTASPTCMASARANVHNRSLRRSGAVKILQLESKTAYSLSSATGKTRLAWSVIGTHPVVQCIEVHRTGNFFTGMHVQLVGIGAPISGEGTCTKPSQLEREEEEATAVER